MRIRTPSLLHAPAALLLAAIAHLASPAGLLAAAQNAAAPALGTPSEQRTQAGTPYRLFRDVPYPAASGDQRMDVYLPSSGNGRPRPAMLIIHGGGWSKGDKGDKREVEFATFMIDDGYAAASINYTLVRYEGGSSKGRKVRGAWPQNITDCKSALRWMRKHAAILGIDPARIGVMGGSAGGHLALLTGLSSGCAELNQGGGNTGQDASARCIIDFYGIPDVRRWHAPFLDESKEANPALWALASPVTHLAPASPPILIIHGTKDQTVPLALSDEFAAILKDKGVRHQYVIVPDGVHSFALCPPQQDLRPVARAFLKEHLSNPPAQQ